MSDYLVKAIDETKNFRAIAVLATDLVGEAQRRHQTWSASSAALGRTLIGTLLLSAAELTEGEELTVRIQGDGPAGAIVATGQADYTVKGYIQNPEVALPLNDRGKIDVRGAVGTTGMFSVTKDLGLKEPFTGQTPIISGEIAEDFTYYLAVSEQIPSSVGLSVFVNPNNTIGAAGGFILQAMPGATDKQLTEMEHKVKELPQLSNQILDGRTPEDILSQLLGPNLKIVETSPVKYYCDCSKEKFGKIIATLSRADINEMIEKDNGAEVVCKFCGNRYHYSAAELQAMIDKK